MLIFDNRDLEKLESPVFAVKAHQTIINGIDGCGGIGIGAPEIVTGSRDGMFHGLPIVKNFTLEEKENGIFCPMYFTITGWHSVHGHVRITSCYTPTTNVMETMYANPLMRLMWCILGFVIICAPLIHQGSDRNDLLSGNTMSNPFKSLQNAPLHVTIY